MNLKVSCWIPATWRYHWINSNSKYPFPRVCITLLSPANSDSRLCIGHALMQPPSREWLVSLNLEILQGELSRSGKNNRNQGWKSSPETKTTRPQSDLEQKRHAEEPDQPDPNKGPNWSDQCHTPPFDRLKTRSEMRRSGLLATTKISIKN